MAQIWLSMAIGQLMHQGTTAVLESRARSSAFKSSVLASRGQASVWPEKLPAGGAWYERLGLWVCMDKPLAGLIIIVGLTVMAGAEISRCGCAYELLIRESCFILLRWSKS